MAKVEAVEALRTVSPEATRKMEHESKYIGITNIPQWFLDKSRTSLITQYYIGDDRFRREIDPSGEPAYTKVFKDRHSETSAEEIEEVISKEDFERNMLNAKRALQKTR